MLAKYAGNVFIELLPGKFGRYEVKLHFCEGGGFLKLILKN